MSWLNSFTRNRPETISWMTKKPTKAETAKWEKILAKEGLAPLDGWYQQYATLGGPELVQLEAVEPFLDQLQIEIGAVDGEALKLENTSEAVFWREAYHRANALPDKHPNRAFLIAVADSGNVEGTAKALGKTTRWGHWHWEKFLNAK